MRWWRRRRSASRHPATRPAGRYIDFDAIWAEEARTGRPAPLPTLDEVLTEHRPIGIDLDAVLLRERTTR